MQLNSTIYNPDIQLEKTLPNALPSIISHRRSLTTDESEAVGRQNLVDGLEVSDTAAGAVSGATGGDTLGLSTRVERASRVTGLGADIGLGEASDAALSVADGGASGADGVAVDTSGGARAADAGTNGGGSAARDGESATSVVVDAALEGVATAATDVAVVVAGEGRTREGTDGGASRGGSSLASGAAVTGGDEASSDGETDRAASRAVDVVGVTTADGSEGGGELRDNLDLVLARNKTDLLGKVLSLSGAVGESLQDELVGSDVDVVGCDTLGGLLTLGQTLDVKSINGLLSLLQLGERSVNSDGLSASGADLGGQGLVSDSDLEVTVNEPGTGEASLALKGLDDISGLELAGNTGVSLLGVESKVALHGSQDVGVKAVGGCGGSTVDDRQEGCDSSEECGDLHDCGSGGDTETRQG